MASNVETPFTSGTSAESGGKRNRRALWLLAIPVLVLVAAWFRPAPETDDESHVLIPAQSTEQTTGRAAEHATGQRQPGSAVSGETAPEDAASQKTTSSNQGMPSTTRSPAETASAEQPGWSRADLSGKWVLNHTIRREIDIQPDGTAVMVCKLDYLTSLIYGKELTLNLEWALNGDLLTHTVVSGTPEKNVKSLTDNFGSSMSYRVLQVDQDTLLLQGPGSSKKKEHWKAVPP